MPNVKLQPIPTNKLPNEFKTICDAFYRNLNAAVLASKLTPDELKSGLETIHDWTMREIKSLPESSAAAT